MLGESDLTHSDLPRGHRKTSKSEWRGLQGYLHLELTNCHKFTMVRCLLLGESWEFQLEILILNPIKSCCCGGFFMGTFSCFSFSEESS